MVNTAKTLEADIESKIKDGQKLQNMHESLRQKIMAMEQQQKKL